MKKNVVVTGAAGFIGVDLVQSLLKEGYEVHAVTRKNGSLWRLEKIKSSIHIHEIGLNNRKQLSSLFKRLSPHAVFHLAAYGSYPSQTDMRQLIQTNITGTVNLLETLHSINCEHLIVVGSSSEYGKKAEPMKETDFLEPNNFYSVCKAAQTHLVQAYAKVYGKPVTILRLFNVYGYFEEKGRLVRSVIESVLQKKPILLAKGKEARDFIFVEDVSDACLYAMKRGPMKGEVFNIGTGVQTTTLQLAQRVIDLIGVSVPIHLNAYAGRSWDTTVWVADMTKTKKVFGWKPKYDLTAGLKKTIAWYMPDRHEKE